MTVLSLDAALVAYCSHVDPKLIAVVKLAATYSTQKFGITTEQSRTLAEEEELVRQGASHTLKSHHIIDCVAPGHWAEPGFSGAVDLVPINEAGAFVWEWPLIYEIAAAMRRASDELATPITFGGVWDKLMSEYGATAAEIETEVAAYTARQHAAGNHSVLLDGPHYERGANSP